jgi:hypothetical protein
MLLPKIIFKIKKYYFNTSLNKKYFQKITVIKLLNPHTYNDQASVGKV